jgi:glycosyltransferase involved in cell wall biosynthesis
MSKISVVITVLNEQKRIQDCLESIKWADEIVIVDDGSTDKTVAIAQKYTDKIIPHKSEGYVEPSRNFAISKATGDWILVLDADEQVPPSLAAKLQEIAKNETKAECVRIPRKNIIFNKWMQHTGWWPDYNIRFFKKGSVTWPNKIHSKAQVHGLVIDLGPQEETALIHYNYDTVSQFLRKLDSYTTVTANERIAEDNQFHWTHMIELPVQEFLSRFFARKGYKDGLHGLVLSLLEGFYEFITCLKVWEQKGFKEVTPNDVMQGFEPSIEESRKQLHFWMYDKKITEESTNLKKQIYKIRRKLNI